MRFRHSETYLLWQLECGVWCKPFKYLLISRFQCTSVKFNEAWIVVFSRFRVVTLSLKYHRARFQYNDYKSQTAVHCFQFAPRNQISKSANVIPWFKGNYGKREREKPKLQHVNLFWKLLTFYFKNKTQCSFPSVSHNLF